MRNHILIVLLIFSCSLNAQKKNSTSPIPIKDEATSSELFALGSYKNGQIRLRWAPKKPLAWWNGNSHGYRIEKMNSNGKYISISPSSILPLPLKQWQSKFSEKNEAAVIAAQCIYGKSFKLNLGKQQPNGLSIADMAAEMMNRHSFGLLSADRDFEVAQSMGLGIIDSQGIEEGKTYTYRIISQVPAKTYKIDTAYVSVSSLDQEIFKDTKVVLEIKSAEKGITLRWPISPYDIIYTGFFVERSANNKDFQAINKIPFTTLKNEVDMNQGSYHYFNDSIGVNGKEFFYRVRGINAFGEFGPYSDSVRGMGEDLTAPASPVILSAENIRNTEIEIKWNYENMPSDFAGFHIEKSSEPTGPFEKITNKLLSKKIRSFIYTQAIGHTKNFFRILAYDEKGNYAASLVAYCVLIDEVNPTKPSGLTAKADTTGVVKINWNKNPDVDVMGYRLFYANQADHKYTQYFSYPLKDTLAEIKIDLKNLTPKMYFKVQAVDYSYNHSEASEAFELIKPDLIKPTQPVIKSFKADYTGIYLDWIPSHSKDVKHHVLLRKSEKEKNWQSIKIIKLNEPNNYTDTKLEPGISYSFCLMAVDEAGNFSEKSFPLEASIIPKKYLDPLKNFQAKTNKKEIDLLWEIPANHDGNFIVYRSYNGKKLQAISKIDKNTNRFTDKLLQGAGKYKYGIKAQFKNGQETLISFTEVSLK